MNIFVTPFKVMNDSFVSKFLFNNEDVLKEFDNPFIDVKMIEFSNHCFLVLKIHFVFVSECIAFVNNVSNVIK